MLADELKELCLDIKNANYSIVYNGYIQPNLTEKLNTFSPPILVGKM